MDRLEKRPYLFIANHSIGAVIEVFALLDAWESKRPGLPIYGLTHRFSFRSPLQLFLRKLGAVPATFDAAYRTLELGHSLIIFPGGAFEATRPFHRRHECDFGGHKGWAEIALRTGVPVVPISISGSHAVNSVLLQTRWLATALVLPRIAGLTYYPLTLSHFAYPMLAYFFLKDFACFPLVFALTFLTCLFCPLLPIVPAKIRIHFGEPISVERGFTESTKENLSTRVSDLIQRGMDRLRGKCLAIPPRA